MKTEPRNSYPLIPPQEMIQFMLKYSFFHKQVTQIPESIILSDKIDFDLMKKAFNIEIERNDCLRLRFFKKGGKIRQYFVDSFTPCDIPILYFKTKQQRVAELTADAQKPVKLLNCVPYRIKFFYAEDGRQGIFLNVHHVVMDNAAVFMFFSDLLAVYDCLKKGGQMPRPLGKYEDSIKKELAFAADPANYAREEKAYREFFEKDGDPLYLGAEGPCLLEAERRRKNDPGINAPSLFDPLNDRAELTKYFIPAEDSRRIFDFMEENGVSGECLVQLAMRLHISKINYRHNDTYFIVLCPRRHNITEKRSGGTLASPVPWRIVLPENTTFSDALVKMKELQYWAFRHMDYPYLEYRKLQQKMYNYPAAAGASTMMFSWFPLEANSMSGYEYEFEGYSMGRYVMVLYSFAMKDIHSGCLKLSCIHRTKFVGRDDINSLFEGTAKALKLGVENPGMTLGEIMNRM